jgi:hypothetical protein
MNPRRRAMASAAVGGVAAGLLLTMGGAVVAAPLSLPALLWVARSRPTGPLRVAAAVVAALTAAELAWALVYVAAGESEPAIWSVPLGAAAVTAAGALWSRSGRSMAVRASAGIGRANR